MVEPFVKRFQEEFQQASPEIKNKFVWSQVSKLAEAAQGIDDTMSHIILRDSNIEEKLRSIETFTPCIYEPKSLILPCEISDKYKRLYDTFREDTWRFGVAYVFNSSYGTKILPSNIPDFSRFLYTLNEIRHSKLLDGTDHCAFYKSVLGSNPRFIDLVSNVDAAVFGMRVAMVPLPLELQLCIAAYL